jgi:hypothetical protein
MFKEGDEVILVDYTHDAFFSKKTLNDWVEQKGLVHTVLNIMSEKTMRVSTMEGRGAWVVNQSDCVLADPNTVSFYEWKEAL